MDNPYAVNPYSTKGSRATRNVVLPLIALAEIIGTKGAAKGDVAMRGIDRLDKKEDEYNLAASDWERQQREMQKEAIARKRQEQQDSYLAEDRKAKAEEFGYKKADREKSAQEQAEYDAIGADTTINDAEKERRYRALALRLGKAVPPPERESQGKDREGDFAYWKRQQDYIKANKTETMDPEERQAKKEEARIRTRAPLAIKEDIENNPTYRGAKEKYAQARRVRTVLDVENPMSDSAVQLLIARASGDTGALSNMDVARWGGSEAILTRIGQLLSKKAKGKMSDENRQFMRELVDAFEKSAIVEIDNELELQRAQQTEIYGDFLPVEKIDRIINTMRIGGLKEKKPEEGGGARVAPPAVGEVRDGWRYLGGNPKDKTSWQKVE